MGLQMPFGGSGQQWEEGGGARESGPAMLPGRFCQCGASSGLWCSHWDAPAGEGAVAARHHGEGQAGRGGHWAASPPRGLTPPCCAL